jgi:hypothetical protein
LAVGVLTLTTRILLLLTRLLTATLLLLTGLLTRVLVLLARIVLVCHGGISVVLTSPELTEGERDCCRGMLVPLRSLRGKGVAAPWSGNLRCKKTSSVQAN